MINIKIRGQRFKCPSSWLEVDINKLVPCETLRDEIEVMTGASLEGIPLDQVLALITLTSFVEEFDLPISEKTVKSVENESYFKIEEAKAILKQEGRAYKKLYALAKLYHPEHTETVQILSVGMALLNQINVFLSAYEEMFNYEPEQEEINAGIEELTGFSTLATVYNLAGKDLLKIDAIGNSPAVVIYGILMYEFKHGQYQKRLHELKYPSK